MTRYHTAKMKAEKERERYPLVGTKILFVTALIISALFPLGADGFPNGSPSAACKDMLPKHGSKTSKTSRCPVFLNLGKTVIKPGVKVSLTLSGTNFRGFLIKIVKQGDTVEMAQGTWSTEEGKGQAKTLACSGGTGVTHTNKTDKKSVKVYWTAPEEGQYDVFFSVAINYDEFWSKQQTKKHETISVTKDGMPIENKSSSSGYLGPEAFIVILLSAAATITVFSAQL